LTTTFPFQGETDPGGHILKKIQHLVKLGLEIDVLAPHYPNAVHHEAVDGINIYRLQYMWPARWQVLCYGAGIQTNLKNNFWAKFQLPIFVLVMFLHTLRIARKADIIHAHWSLAGLAGVLAGKVLDKPVVLMMHHAEVKMTGASFLIKFVLEHVDYVLCNSSFTRSKVLEISRPKGCDVVFIGVDTEQFQPNIDLTPFYEREPDTPRDIPLVLAFGRFIELKGFEYLVEAIALLDQDPAPYLMLGGHGPFQEQLQRQVRDRGITDRVKFLGYVPNELTPLYYSAADVVVVPSIIDRRGETEGLGIISLEALACGTPCVASNVGGIPDVIVDGVNGYLVEPKNPQLLAKRIKQLTVNDNLLQDMGIKGRQFVEKNFSWQGKVREILNIYQTILEADHGASASSKSN